MSFITAIGEIAVTEGPLSGQVTIEWQIEDFFSLFGRWYKSPTFRFSDMCVYLNLFPKAANYPEPSGGVQIDLGRADSGPPKTLLIKFGIKSPNGLKFERKGEGELKLGKFSCLRSAALCSRSTLKNESSNLMPENVLTFKVFLTSTVPSVPIGCCETRRDKKLGVDEFLKSMRNLLNSAETADFTIKVQDKEYPVHTQILGARSEVFKSMFTHDMIEKNNGGVTIADCDPEVFRDFLEYIYTGSTDISAKNVVDLYTVSDKYDVSSLKEECTEYMKRTLTAANVCDVMRLSLKHDDKELLKCATDFFCINAFTIINTDDLKSFLDENSKFGNELFIKVLSKYQGTSSGISLPPLKKQKTNTS